MKNTPRKNIIAQGFSLIEMLVVIAVIGVIAAIAIPSISGINDAAAKSKDQRNAQNIVSVYQAGVAAGIDWKATSEADLVTKVVTGQKVTGGAFDGKFFQVPGVTGTDATSAANYIKYDSDNKVFSYNKDGK